MATSTREARAGDAATEVQQRFPPHILREYALLADGWRGVLCGPRGEVVWMCTPRWHDDAVFSALLGGRGAYVVQPVEPFVWGGHYEPRSLIWRNRWVTTSGIVECREALRYPGDKDRPVLLRRILAEHDCTVYIELEAHAGFGAHDAVIHGRDSGGRWTIRSGALWLRWSGAGHAQPTPEGKLHARVDLFGGESHDLVLEIDTSPPGEPINPEQAWRTTESAWHDAVAPLDGVVAQRDAEQAIAVLRGMTAPQSGMAAAATMCLPERAEQGGDYDYRYSWIRDQSYAGVAAAKAGHPALLDDAVAFVTSRVLAEPEQISPVYTVDGHGVAGSTRLALPGYPGGQDVVAGNRATHQHQLDTLGETLQLLSAAGHRDRLNSDGWRAVHQVVRHIRRTWQLPDAGLWELQKEWWTQSRLACIAGLRAVAPLAPRGNERAELTELATMLRETTRRCLHPNGHWQRSPNHTGTGGALALPPVRGGLPATDGRTRATLDAIRRELVQDGYVYRYKQAGQPLGRNEGAFLLCGFVLALAEHQQGEQLSAFRLLERHRAACGSPGLFAEEFDVQQRQLRGNLPQAFVHAMLLECCSSLSE